jgi:hypothetical protein
VVPTAWRDDALRCATSPVREQDHDIA